MAPAWCPTWPEAATLLAGLLQVSGEVPAEVPEPEAAPMQEADEAEEAAGALAKARVLSWLGGSTSFSAAV